MYCEIKFVTKQLNITDIVIWVGILQIIYDFGLQNVLAIAIVFVISSVRYIDGLFNAKMKVCTRDQTSTSLFT